MDLSLPRRVEPELLDDLAVDDPRAQRSRDDLRRIHRAMATLSVLKRALDSATSGSPPHTIVELGAGDGSLMLRLAQRRAVRWPGVHVTLLDRLDLIAPRTLDALRTLGWTPGVVAMDVFDWLARPDATRRDIVFANLFIHHFSAEPLARLLAGIEQRCRIFFCCEPRRAALALAGSHLIGFLGAGPVTRKDAVSSVHAGFRGQELSERWPNKSAWVLHEFSAGLFSHGFLAIRKSS
ncbi:MAG: hypothetical protein ABI728_10740 [Betaproteobacteria bacterium]